MGKPTLDYAQSPRDPDAWVNPALWALMCIIAACMLILAVSAIVTGWN